MDIRFLAVAEVITIHDDMIQRYGGGTGIREISLLESAVSMPEATFGEVFLHDSLPSMAAAYCFHLVSNHPFVDGNKRVGAAAAVVFLKLNGWALVAEQDAYADVVLKVAAGEMDKRGITDFFIRHSNPPTSS